MKNRWLATLALATDCTAPLLLHTGTTKSEWKETLDCTMSKNLAAFDASPASCWTVEKKGTINKFGEYHEFSSDRQFIIISLYLARHTLSGGRMTPSQPSPPPLDSSKTRTPCWVARRREPYPFSSGSNAPRAVILKTNSYGNGCFAFVSTGGSKGGRSHYMLGAIACNRDGSPMTLEQRQTISQSIRIKHPGYKALRNTF